MLAAAILRKSTSLSRIRWISNRLVQWEQQQQRDGDTFAVWENTQFNTDNKDDDEEEGGHKMLDVDRDKDSIWWRPFAIFACCSLLTGAGECPIRGITRLSRRDHTTSETIATTMRVKGAGPLSFALWTLTDRLRVLGLPWNIAISMCSNSACSSNFAEEYFAFQDMVD